MRVLTILALLFVFALALIAGPVSAESPQEQGYLPYGLRVAPGVDINNPPPPFDNSVHGAPIPNTQAVNNLVGKPNVTLPTRKVITPSISTDQIPTLDPGSGDRGLWLTNGSGVYAQNDAQADLSLPDSAIGTTLYAPTHMAPGGTCIETVTAHWRYEGMSSTSHGHGFWDWCASDGSGGWQVFEFMDSTWNDKYVRRLNKELRYWTQVYQDSTTGAWKGLLYNFKEGRWEEKTSISGTNNSGFGNTGWTMWESHYLMDQAQVCPSLPNIQASSLQVFVNGSWSKLTRTNTQDLGPYGLCWTNGQYSFKLSSKLDMWSALTQLR